MAAALSRSGSTEMNQALTLSASVPIARRISEISNSEVGQTSGQWVKPKKIRVGWPCRSFSVTVAPLWSVSWNGPPIAAGAVTPRTPPMPHSTTSSPINRLAVKAVTITSGRAAVRSIGKSPVSEAACEAGGDGLEEHRGAVMDPQRERRREQQATEAGPAPDHGHPQSAP